MTMRVDLNDLEELKRMLERACAEGCHVTIMKFTTNWRASFDTPACRQDIQEMGCGATLRGAIQRARALRPVNREIEGPHIMLRRVAPPPTGG